MMRWLRGAGLILYALIMFLAGVYLTFPYARFEQYLLASLRERAGLDITVQRGRLLFPLGMIWQDVTVTRHGQAPYRFDLVRAEVEPLAVLRGRIRLRVEAAAYGGRGTGQVTIVRWSGRNGPAHYAVSAMVREVDLARLPATAGQATGHASLAFDGEWDGEAVLTGNGRSEMDLTGLQFKAITFKGLALPPVAFATTRIRAQWRQGMVEVIEVQARGPEMTLAGNGSLLMREPVVESLINLLVHVTVPEGGRVAEALRVLGNAFQVSSPLEASIKGTIGRPTITVNNIPVML